MTDDAERQLIEIIDTIHRDYARQVKPYIDRLVHLRSLRTDPIYITIEQAKEMQLSIARKEGAMKLSDAERSYIEHMDWPESCAEHFKAAGYRAGVEASAKVCEELGAFNMDDPGESSAAAIRKLLD